MKGSSGVFGVLPGHVPTIAQLQPGTVTVEYDSEEGGTKVSPALRCLCGCFARLVVLDAAYAFAVRGFFRQCWLRIRKVEFRCGYMCGGSVQS